MRLDVGCGNALPPGWTGLDIVQLPGVDFVTDARLPWPVKDGVVEQGRCHHFFEHLLPVHRAHVMREFHRVLVPGAKVTFTTPLGFNRMVQDPDHKWPPVVKGTFYYYSRRWRDANGLGHYEQLHGLTMDFEMEAVATKYDPDQYPTHIGKERLELLLMADPDAQTDLVVTLRRVP